MLKKLFGKKKKQIHTKLKSQEHTCELVLTTTNALQLKDQTQKALESSFTDTAECIEMLRKISERRSSGVEAYGKLISDFFDTGKYQEAEITKLSGGFMGTLQVRLTNWITRLQAKDGVDKEEIKHYDRFLSVKLKGMITSKELIVLSHMLSDDNQRFFDGSNTVADECLQIITDYIFISELTSSIRETRLVCQAILELLTNDADDKNKEYRKVLFVGKVKKLSNRIFVVDNKIKNIPDFPEMPKKIVKDLTEVCQRLEEGIKR